MRPTDEVDDQPALLAVPSVPASVAAIRRFAAAACGRLGYEQASDVAQLLVSEVATNALVHGAGEVRVRVASTGTGLRFEVADGSSAMPWRRDAGPDAESGRGLGLVAALATDWGAFATGEGKVVWFEVGPDDSLTRRATG